MSENRKQGRISYWREFVFRRQSGYGYRLRIRTSIYVELFHVPDPNAVPHLPSPNASLPKDKLGVNTLFEKLACTSEGDAVHVCYVCVNKRTGRCE